MTARFALNQEDRIYLCHIERALVTLLRRTSNQPTQNEALAALLSGLWNLPFVTPGLSCAIECPYDEVTARFEISTEWLSFSYGSDFHASFWVNDRHVGSRFGESPRQEDNYHSWKVLLEMFENDLSDPETEFTVELISRPSLTETPWHDLPSWEDKGSRGIGDIQS